MTSEHTGAGNARRQRLHDELNYLRELCNRIAHHEPIHGRNLADDYATMLDTAKRFPAAGPMIDNTSRVPLVLSQRS